MEKHELTPERYWAANVRLVAILLTIWFFVSFGCGILFSDFLDQFRIGGFKLGFWMAQQGSIYTFVLLIFIYVKRMNVLDKRFREAHRGEPAPEEDFEI